MAMSILRTTCRMRFHSTKLAPSRNFSADLFLGSPSIRRVFATNIEPPLTTKEFFNREKEIRALTKLLKDKPQFSLITGPVNSGKTSLLLNLLQKEARDNRPVLHLDLRKISFNTVDEFASSFEDKLKSWLSKFTEVAKRLKLDTQGYGISLNASLLEDHGPIAPIKRLNRLFEAMSNQLPLFSFWSGSHTPILFIDEANKLRALLKDKYGHEALTNLFEWFVVNTKQDHRFHVILSSSDSFYHLWLEKYIGASRFTSYVVGNLPKNEALRFWNERVIYKLDSLLPPKFEEAYEVCGGNMFLLEKYFAQFNQVEGNMRSEDFFLVEAEKSKLITALFKNEGTLSSPDKAEGKPIWTREQLIKMMEYLVSSKNGFLNYDDICKELGKNVVDAFIDLNILHLRPNKNFAYDIDVFHGGTILTPETPSSLVAMKKVLAKIKKEEL